MRSRRAIPRGDFFDNVEPLFGRQSRRTQLRRTSWWTPDLARGGCCGCSGHRRPSPAGGRPRSSGFIHRLALVPPAGLRPALHDAAVDPVRALCRRPRRRDPVRSGQLHPRAPRWRTAAQRDGGAAPRPRAPLPRLALVGALELRSWSWASRRHLWPGRRWPRPSTPRPSARPTRSSTRTLATTSSASRRTASPGAGRLALSWSSAWPARPSTPPRAAPAASSSLPSIGLGHLSLFASAFFLLLAVHYRLAMYSLLTGQNGTVFGAGYTDIHVRLPAYWVLLVLTLLLAVALLVTVWRPQPLLLAAAPCPLAGGAPLRHRGGPCPGPGDHGSPCRADPGTRFHRQGDRLHQPRLRAGSHLIQRLPRQGDGDSSAAHRQPGAPSTTSGCGTTARSRTRTTRSRPSASTTTSTTSTSTATCSPTATTR